MFDKDYIERSKEVNKEEWGRGRSKFILDGGIHRPCSPRGSEKSTILREWWIDLKRFYISSVMSR